MNPTVVMLVDDETPFVETLTKRLSRRNILVNKAYSGMEAIDKLDAGDKIDAVILDMKMPYLDGIETLKEIKKRRPHLQVIMLTGHATLESALEGMKLGAFDYLTKPCDIDRLVAKVFEAVGKKESVEKPTPACECEMPASGRNLRK